MLTALGLNVLLHRPVKLETQVHPAGVRQRCLSPKIDVQRFPSAEPTQLQQTESRFAQDGFRETPELDPGIDRPDAEVVWVQFRDSLYDMMQLNEDQAMEVSRARDDIIFEVEIG
ncbi:MAG: hypothetical protein EOP09_15505 [Proteobacteria bacterium]|nr:MAG: hypothetical protein EOP09_15505 [Pseudomonadota bacterium]